MSWSIVVWAKQLNCHDGMVYTGFHTKELAETWARNHLIGYMWEVFITQTIQEA